MTSAIREFFDQDARRALPLPLASVGPDEEVAIDRSTVEALGRLFADDEFRLIAQLVTGLDELASYVEPSPDDAKRWIQLYGVAWVVHERYAQTAERQSPRYPYITNDASADERRERRDDGRDDGARASGGASSGGVESVTVRTGGEEL